MNFLTREALSWSRKVAQYFDAMIHRMNLDRAKAKNNGPRGKKFGASICMSDNVSREVK